MTVTITIKRDPKTDEIIVTDDGGDFENAYFSEDDGERSTYSALSDARFEADYRGEHYRHTSDVKVFEQ